MKTLLQNGTLVTKAAIPLSGFRDVVNLALQGIRTTCNAIYPLS